MNATSEGNSFTLRVEHNRLFVVDRTDVSVDARRFISSNRHEIQGRDISRQVLFDAEAPTDVETASLIENRKRVLGTRESPDTISSFWLWAKIWFTTEPMTRTAFYGFVWSASFAYDWEHLLFEDNNELKTSENWRSVHSLRPTKVFIDSCSMLGSIVLSEGAVSR